MLLNGGVWVWVFEPIIQPYLCWLWSLFGLLLNSLEITVHGSSSRLELLECLSLAKFLFEVFLLTKNALLARVSSAGWTLITKGSDHVMRSLITCLCSLLVHHIGLVRCCHHGGWRCNAHLIQRNEILHSSSSLLDCFRIHSVSTIRSFRNSLRSNYRSKVLSVSRWILSINDKGSSFVLSSILANASFSRWLRLQQNLLIHYFIKYKKFI
jgi:hypothetical protein